MPTDEPAHECDLFLLSSHRPYLADRILPEFARQVRRNVDGWGIGTYIDGRARVVKSPEPATDGAEISREFAIAVEAVSGPTILGHLRLTSRGENRRKNNHPFLLPFLDSEWLLIHNGTAISPDRLLPPDERLLPESTSDTPRVFEFLRCQIIDYYLADPRHSLIESVRKAYGALLDRDPGKFNLILSNGHLSFVFVHWRPFYLLHREKDSGDVALVSTIELTPGEEWVKFEALRGKRAKILVFSGPTLVLNGDVS